MQAQVEEAGFYIPHDGAQTLATLLEHSDASPRTVQRTIRHYGLLVDASIKRAGRGGPLGEVLALALILRLFVPAEYSAFIREGARDGDATLTAFFELEWARSMCADRKEVAAQLIGLLAAIKSYGDNMVLRLVSRNWCMRQGTSLRARARNGRSSKPEQGCPTL